MSEPQKYTVMVVDDSKLNIEILVALLSDEYDIMVARDGQSALRIMRENVPDLVLLDIMMPKMDGIEVCRHMKADSVLRHVDVIFVTAMGEDFDEQHGLEVGAVDYITKPIRPSIVKLRVRNHLELRRIRRQLLQHNHELEEKVCQRTHEIQRIQDVTIECLASIAETRDPETGGHIQRTKHYVSLLLDKIMLQHPCCPDLTPEIAQMIVKSAPLHDIGKVGIPDSILLKPGKLTDEEFQIIKAHPYYGYKALHKAGGRLGSGSFLDVAADLSYTHHEKWDGSGYPRGLKGAQIPWSGRLMALADVYDALISRRSYKDSFSHQRAVEIISRGDGRTKPDHFDPVVLEAFMANHSMFEQISRRYSDEE